MIDYTHEMIPSAIMMSSYHQQHCIFDAIKEQKKKFTPPSSARSIVIVALAIINHLIIDLKLNDHHHHQHNHQTPSQATTDEIQKEMSERQKNESIQKRHTHTFLDTYIPSGRHHRIMVVN